MRKPPTYFTIKQMRRSILIRLWQKLTRKNTLDAEETRALELVNYRLKKMPVEEMNLNRHSA